MKLTDKAFNKQMIPFNSQNFNLLAELFCKRIANISLQYCLLESNSFCEIRLIIHFKISVFSTIVSANFGSIEIKFSNIPL